MTEEQIDGLFNKLNQIFVEPKEGEQKPVHKLFSDEKYVREIYEKAKQSLVSQGCSSKLVEAMPVRQAVLAYSFDRYLYWRDELFKWYGLPYFQAISGLHYVEGQLSRGPADLSEGAPFRELLPSLARARLLLVRSERNLDALSCIEAIRMYAADHGGKLPVSLKEITQVPIPINRDTGAPFGYQLNDKTAILDAPALEGMSPSDITQYKLTIDK